MTPIRLPTVDADTDPPKRLHIFPHRHLGRDEFRIRDRYLTQRLDALAFGAAEGVVAGLALSPAAYDSAGDGAPPDRILVQPGIAVLGGHRVLRLTAPLSVALRDLLPKPEDGPDTGSRPRIEDGFYLLTLRLAEAGTVHGPADRPDARDVADPLRDERRDSFVEAALSPRLAPLPSRFGPMRADRFANLRAAELVGGSALAQTGGAVPLALLALRGNQMVWLNQAAGRWEAAPDAGARLLAAQVRDALARVVAANGLMTKDQHRALRMRLPRLPAAGQLPALLLLDPAGTSPACLMFPPQMDVTMAPLPASAVPAVLRREMRRAPLDMRRRAGDAVTLLPVVADRDWRPDLADRPRPDLRLLEQLFAAYHQARLDWSSVAEAHAAIFNGLAGMPEELRRRLGAALAFAADPRPEGPRAVLDTAGAASLKTDEGFDTAIDALEDDKVFAAWVDKREAALDKLTAEETVLARLAARGQAPQASPEPPADADAIADTAWQGTGSEVAWVRARSHYRDWLQEHEHAPVAPPDPGAAPGLLAELALAQLRLTLAEGRIAHYASRLAEHGDLLVTQRSHLRFLTSSLARLTAPATVSAAATTAPARQDAPMRYAMLPDSGQVSQGSPALAYFKAATASRDASPAFLKALSPKGLETSFAGQMVQFQIGQSVARGTYARDVGDAGLSFTAARMKKLGITEALPPDKAAPRTTGGLEDEAIATLPPQIEAMFDAIGATERLRRGLETRQHRFAVLAAELRDRIAGLTAELAAARAARAAAARKAAASEGDYLSAQRLVAEEAARVVKAAAERDRILGAPLALLYVRRRQVQLAAPLPDPLALRATAPGDLVPGCRDTHDGPLPEGVDQFLEFVLDLPVAAFAALAGLQAHLPGGEALAALGRARMARLSAREAMAGAALAAAASAATPAAPRLLPILRRAQATVAPLAARPFLLTGSLAATQQEAARVLSVADVLAGRRSPLREAAAALRDRLETAGHCVLASLSKLPPSMRFAWSEAAEDDTLDLRQPERWPLFGAGEEDDEAFNALRTLTELVRFLHAQLAPGADGTAQAAMGSYLRALLIEAAHGEPAELLRGRVTALPRLMQPGAVLRLALNREARPGTRLHLLDGSRQVVAELRVEDRDGEGVVASLLRITRPDAQLAAGLAVTAAR